MIDRSEIEVFILAGGKSRRMGMDKGLVHYNGQPMITRILNVLEELELETCIISSNPDYLKFGKPVLQDLIPGKGPMGGLYTALSYSKAPMVFLIACDMPAINREGVESLLTYSEIGSITIARDAKQISPLFACYPRSLLSNVKEAVLTDHLKMQDFVKKQKHRVVDFEILYKSEVLQNFNTREELNAAENAEHESDN